MKDIAVLDANILYGAYSRDIILTFVEEGLFIGVWTERILEEYTRSLIKNRPNLKQKIRRTKAIIKDTFPDSLVKGYEDFEKGLILPDPNDVHVLAAAIHAEAQFIVTHNLKDFPRRYLKEFGILPIGPDPFLNRIIREAPSHSLMAFEKMINRYKRNPRSTKAILDKLRKDGLHRVATELESLSNEG